MAEQWISDARRHLDAAQAINTIDPSGTEYGSRSFGKAEVDEAIRSAGAIVEAWRDRHSLTKESDVKADWETGRIGIGDPELTPDSAGAGLVGA